MKTLVILGSPRKKGNSETLAAMIADHLEQQVGCQTEYLRLAKSDISGCIGCGGCEKTGLCVVADDMAAIYEQVDEADIIFLVSPIYFYGPSAQLKLMVDRFQARWSRKYLLKERFRRKDKRAGYLLSTAATQGKKLFDGSILIAKSFFDAIDVDYHGEFVVRGVDGRGEFAESETEAQRALEFAEQIGRSFK